MATQTRKRIAEKLVALHKVHVVTSTDRVESNELEGVLRRMRCFGLWEKKVVDWESIIGELVHKLATNTKRGQPSYIGFFLFHFYAHGNLITNEEKIQWTNASVHAGAPDYRLGAGDGP